MFKSMERTVEEEIDLNMEQSNEVSDSLRWAVVKSMMNAQRHSNAGLEQYLLYVTHEEFDLNEEELEVCLNEAITCQKRALEDLEAARDLIEES